MKKILISILGILIGFVGVSSASFSVIVHYNGTTTTYTVSENEGNLYLKGGNRSESNDYYTYNGYDYTDIYYTDQFGRQKSDRVISDQYLNGSYNLSYTGNGYSELTSDLDCSSSSGSIIIYTGSDIPVRLETSTGNVFSSFVDNALLLITGNIPGFISFGFIFVFIILFVRLFIPKRRR